VRTGVTDGLGCVSSLGNRRIVDPLCGGVSASLGAYAGRSCSAGAFFFSERYLDGNGIVVCLELYDEWNEVACL
jgi:hypothetical protein